MIGWLTLVVLVGAAASLADRSQPVSEEPVSTRPTTEIRTVSIAPTPSRSSFADSTFTPSTPALTRAAAQRRIDEMSPTAWLAQYGDVSVGHRR